MEAALGQLFDSLAVGAGGDDSLQPCSGAAAEFARVVDCAAMTLNGGTNNVVLTNEQVPQLGTVTITEGA